MRREVETPALLLDLDLARRNITRMAAVMGELGTGLRPHIKAHKSPELARLQIAAGAVGVACATVWEAAVMARTAEIADILVANEVVGDAKLRTLAALARDHRITVAVDDPANARQLSRAAVAAGSSLGVLIEVDVGMGRAGVRTAGTGSRARTCSGRASSLVMRGVQGYEGHCMVEDDEAAREASNATEANEALLSQIVDALAAAGPATRARSLTGGGTGTYSGDGRESANRRDSGRQPTS